MDLVNQASLLMLVLLLLSSPSLAPPSLPNMVTSGSKKHNGDGQNPNLRLQKPIGDVTTSTFITMTPTNICRFWRPGTSLVLSVLDRHGLIDKCTFVWKLSVHFQFPGGFFNWLRPKCLQPIRSTMVSDTCRLGSACSVLKHSEQLNM